VRRRSAAPSAPPAKQRCWPPPLPPTSSAALAVATPFFGSGGPGAAGGNQRRGPAFPESFPRARVPRKPSPVTSVYPTTVLVVEVLVPSQATRPGALTALVGVHKDGTPLKTPSSVQYTVKKPSGLAAVTVNGYKGSDALFSVVSVSAFEDVVPQHTKLLKEQADQQPGAAVADQCWATPRRGEAARGGSGARLRKRWRQGPARIRGGCSAQAARRCKAPKAPGRSAFGAQRSKRPGGTCSTPARAGGGGGSHRPSSLRAHQTNAAARLFPGEGCMQPHHNTTTTTTTATTAATTATAAATATASVLLKLSLGCCEKEVLRSSARCAWVQTHCVHWCR